MILPPFEGRKTTVAKAYSYVIEPDSPEGSNVKHELREIPCSSEDFINAVAPAEHGFKVIAGKGTDLLALKMNGLGVSCMNVSAGFYHPHKDDEYTLLPELQKSLEYIQYIITHVTQSFPHVFKTKTQLWVEHNNSSLNQLSTTSSVISPSSSAAV